MSKGSFGATVDWIVPQDLPQSTEEGIDVRHGYVSRGENPVDELGRARGVPGSKRPLSSEINLVGCRGEGLDAPQDFSILACWLLLGSANGGTDWTQGLFAGAV